MHSDFFVTDVALACYKSYGSGYVFRQKKRKYEGITLILSGEMEWVGEGEHFILRAGDLLLQEKNDTYQLKVTGDDPAEYIVISYLAEPIEHLRSLLPRRFYHTPRLSKYKDLFEETVRLSGSLASCAGTRLCAAVQDILCCVIQEYARKSSAPENSFAEHAMLFMEQNFNLPLPCDLIAAEVGISPSHLRSLFKKEYGTSLVTALNEIRIRHAKNMLKSGAFTLREVASQCGFQNEYYFSRVFKEITGTSPGKY